MPVPDLTATPVTIGALLGGTKEHFGASVALATMDTKRLRTLRALLDLAAPEFRDLPNFEEHRSRIATLHRQVDVMIRSREAKEAYDQLLNETVWFTWH